MDDSLSLAFRFEQPLEGTKIPVGEMKRLFELFEQRRPGLGYASHAERVNAPIYVEDVASLNRLDWNVSVDTALSQLPEGELATIIKLDDIGLAGYNPYVIYTVDGRVLRLKKNSIKQLPEAGSKISYHLSRRSDFEHEGYDDPNDDAYLVLLQQLEK